MIFQEDPAALDDGDSSDWIVGERTFHEGKSAYATTDHNVVGVRVHGGILWINVDDRISQI